MARQVRTGLLITGDPSGAVRATQVTREELEKLNQKTDQTTDRQSRLSDQVGRVGNRLVTATAQVAKYAAAIAAAGAAMLAHLINRGRQAADELAKQADTIGVNTEWLGRYTVVADRAGVGNARFGQSVTRMVTALTDADENGGKLADTLERTGINLRELRDLNPEQQFESLSEQVRNLSNHQDRLSVVTELYGQQAGPQMLRVMMQSAEAVDHFSRRAEVAGVTLDRVTAAQIEAMNDSLSDTRMLLDGFGQQLAGQFAPLIEAAANELFGMAEEAGGMGHIAEQVFNGVIRGAGFVGDALRLLHIAWRAQHAVIATLGSVAFGVLQTIGEGFAAFVDQQLDRVNTMIRAISRLPWVDIEQIDPFSEGRMMRGLRDLREEARESAETVRSELHDLAMSELPSERFKRFSLDIQEASRQAAERTVTDQQTIQQVYSETEDAVDDLVETNTQGSDDVARAWAEAMNRVDSAFSDLWQSAFRGFGDFADQLKGSFRQLLGEMAHFAITRPILVNAGILGAGTGGALGAAASTGAAAGGMGGMGGMGAAGALGLGGMLSGGMANLSGMLTQGVVGASNLLTTLGAGGLATQLQLQAANLSGLPGGLAGGLGISAGAGVLGNLLSNQIFGGGGHSGLGGTLGGIAGTLFGGPVGGGIGSFLGSAIGSVFGSSGPKTGALGVHTGPASSDRHIVDEMVAASGLRLQAIERRVGEEGQQAARQMMEAFGELDATMTGLLRSVGVEVNLTGRQLDGLSASSKHLTGQGFFGSNVEGLSQRMLEEAPDQFVRAWLEEVNHLLPQRVRSVMSRGLNQTAEEMVEGLQHALAIDALLDLDVVGETRKALRELDMEQLTVLESYGRHTERVTELAREYDHTSESLAGLSEALRSQKSVAAELALMYQTLGDQIDQSFGSASQWIREQLMDEEELYAFRQSELQRLMGELDGALDPGRIENLAGEIERLTRTAFGSLDEGQQREVGEDFVDFLSEANRVAQRQLEEGLEQLRRREEETASAMDFELSVEAANTQMEAAQLFSQSVDRFNRSVAAFEFSGEGWVGAEVNQ